MFPAAFLPLCSLVTHLGRYFPTILGSHLRDNVLSRYQLQSATAQNRAEIVRQYVSLEHVIQFFA